MIFKELNKALDTFNASGGASLLWMNKENIIISELPNFDINLIENISHKKYMNKITKGVYELDQFLILVLQLL